MNFTNVPIEMGPGGFGVGLPQPLMAKLTDNPTPPGVSQGRLMCGLAVPSALVALSMVQGGIPIGHVYWDPYAPIVPGR
jgi:hypothetical protein